MNQPQEQNSFSTSTPMQAVVAQHAEHSRLTTAVQFIAVTLIWSLTPLSAVWTVHEMHWAWGLFFRFSLALIIAIPCLIYFRQRLEFHPQALLSYLAGAVGLLGAMTFCYIGASYVSSALIAIIYGLAPLVSGLIASFLLKQQKFSLLQWFGLLLGITGLAVSLGAGTTHVQLHLFGTGMEIIAMLLYVLSTFAVRAVGSQIHPVSQMMGTTLVSWLGYLLLLPFFWQYLPSGIPSLKTNLAILYSALFSSVLAMVLYYKLLKKIQTTTLLLITILTPVLATFWGALLNGETLHMHVLTGVFLLCTGLILYTGRSYLKR